MVEKNIKRHFRAYVTLNPSLRDSKTIWSMKIQKGVEFTRTLRASVLSSIASASQERSTT